MAASRKIGSNYQEALLALSEQVARLYREACRDDYIVTAHLFQGDTLICVNVIFPATGAEAWVPLEFGNEGWNDERKARIIHDASYVIGKRLELEKFTAQYVSARIQEVIRAYR